MTNPRRVKGDELERIRIDFKANSNADIVEHVRLVRFSADHVLVEQTDNEALLFTISKMAR